MVLPSETAFFARAYKRKLLRRLLLSPDPLFFVCSEKLIEQPFLRTGGICMENVDLSGVRAAVGKSGIEKTKYRVIRLVCTGQGTDGTYDEIIDLFGFSQAFLSGWSSIVITLKRFRPFSINAARSIPSAL